MSRKGKRQPPGGRNVGSFPRIRWIGGLIVLMAIGAVSSLYWYRTMADAQIDATVISGRWLRPDGRYVLELKDIGPEGSVKARYLNPRSINVSQAGWEIEDGRLKVFVELHDVHYPGSTYTLVYVEENDRLYGIYYQAALRQQFDVEFVRIK